jgi:hypothetical protein
MSLRKAPLLERGRSCHCCLYHDGFRGSCSRKRRRRVLVAFDMGVCENIHTTVLYLQSYYGTRSARFTYCMKFHIYIFGIESNTDPESHKPE